MHYEKHFVQFNDFVFDEYDMIAGGDTSASFRQESTPYTFIHGSYTPYKRKGVTVESGSVSLTLTLNVKKLPCEDRPFYLRFVKNELQRQGRLWAVSDNTLIWAYAYMTDYAEETGRRDTLEIDVSFALPEGIWHKADKLRTFLAPYDVCDFMDCYDFHDVNPCLTQGCCNCVEVSDTFCDCCNDCWNVTKDMALCYHMGELQDFYNRCGSGYRILYDCQRAQNFFGDFLGAEHLGQKFCTNNDGLIAGILYSETDIDTSHIRITIHGAMKNPYIEINGNGNIIKGEFEGVLTINSDGSVYYTSDDACCANEPLDVELWSIPLGMDYGWLIHQGNNQILIDTGVCDPCGRVTCAYIEHDPLTY